MITVGEIHTAPVKSLALERRPAVQVGPQGISDDRRFYIIDQHGRLITQREIGRLTQIRAGFDAESSELALEFPDGEQISGTVEPGRAVRTRIWSRPVLGNVLQGDWNEALSRFCEQPVMLVMAEQAGQCFDEFPISLLSRASVQQLEQHAGTRGTLDGRRFRPTFLLENAEPHEEDSWVGHSIQIGPQLVLQVISYDPRCAIITQDPDTGKPDVDTLAVIRGYRSGSAAYFGVYAQVVTPGLATEGDEVRLL